MNVEQLKNSILKLAIQGKLVEQREEEGTAEKLYQQIQLEKNQLIKEGKLKKSKPLPLINPQQIPFDIPSNWKWVLLGDLFSNQSGLTYNKSNLDIIEKAMVRVMRGGNISELSYEFKNDDVFIGKSYVSDSLLLKKNTLITPAVTSLTHIGKLVRIESDYNDVVVGGFVLMLKPFSNIDLLSKFLEYSMNSDYVRNVLRDSTNKSGQAFYNLSRTAMNEIKIPLPPLSEQQRIVDKIEELLPLIEEYGKSYVKLEQLNKNFPQDIKQSILQYAIQGKLVEQREEEETAEELYQQIQLEKNQLIKEGKLKKSKPLPPINVDELPFEIPATWKWLRLGDICSTKQWKTLPMSKIRGGTYPVYGANGIIGYTDIYNHQEPTLLLTCRGATCGYTNISEPFSYINGNAFSFDQLSRYVSMHYLRVFFDAVDLYATGIVTGTAQPQITKSNLDPTLIPMPPLGEQNRIDDKIEELLSITKALEGEIQ